MRPRTKARLGAIVILGLLFCIGDYFIHADRRDQGKVAFLAEQAEQFDDMYAGKYRLGSSLVFSLVVAAGVLGAYELVATGLLAILQRRKGPASGGA